jgi:hypothetical protein
MEMLRFLQPRHAPALAAATARTLTAHRGPEVWQDKYDPRPRTQTATAAGNPATA